MFIKAQELYNICEKADNQRISADVAKLSQVITDKFSFIVKNPRCEEARNRSFAAYVYYYHDSAVVFIHDELIKAGYNVSITKIVEPFAPERQHEGGYSKILISWANESRCQVKTQTVWIKHDQFKF